MATEPRPGERRTLWAVYEDREHCHVERIEADWSARFRLWVEYPDGILGEQRMWDADACHPTEAEALRDAIPRMGRHVHAARARLRALEAGTDA